jgi:hypothetical protein
MTEYALYIESGPRRQKTMVHVLDLLGCTVQAPTTEEAVAAAPDAIREYLRFLRRHFDGVNPEAHVDVTVAAHVTEGVSLGNGDPAPGFPPDFEPLTHEDHALYLRRLAWLRGDFLHVVRAIPRRLLMAEMPDGNRSIYRVAEHIAEMECSVLANFAGKVSGVTEALKEVQRGPEHLPDALQDLWLVITARLKGLSEEEHSLHVSRGPVTWTARRVFRRLLEHDWEHLQELSRRVELIREQTAPPTISRYPMLARR